MPTVNFTSHLDSYADTRPVRVEGSTAGQAVRAALEGNARLRSYLFDDQDRLRRHIMVFVDGKILIDRARLSDPVSADSEIYIMQALSGG